MSNFRKKLKRQQDSFNRKVRRVVIVIGVAALLIGGFLAYLYFAPFQKSRPKPPDITNKQALETPTVVPTADPDDPAQLVLPGLIMAERPANPVTVTSTGKKTKIDKALMALVLEAVKKVPQDEMEARVDPTIKWVDFTDAKKREQIRGRVSQFRGTLRRLEKSPGVKFPSLGIDTLYEGQIQGSRGHWFSFYCLEKPEKEIKRSDIAILTGVYYKLIRFSTRGGGEKITPLIIASTITARRGYDTPAAAGGAQAAGGYLPSWAIYLLFAAVAIGLCVFFHYRLKQPTRTYRRKEYTRSEDEEQNKTK